MTTKKREAPWVHAVNLLTLSLPHELALVPDVECRARIARFTGLSRIDRLEARITLTSGPRDGVTVTGHISADVTPVCTVSLEAFDDKLETGIDIKYASAETIAYMEKRAAADEVDDFEAPDELVNNEIDLGAVVVEFLILGLDPYPKKPGVAFDAGPAGSEKISPFAALQALVKPK